MLPSPISVSCVMLLLERQRIQISQLCSATSRPDIAVCTTQNVQSPGPDPLHLTPRPFIAVESVQQMIMYLNWWGACLEGGAK